MGEMGKINLAEKLGLDDTEYAIPMGQVDRLFLDEWEKGGAVTAVTYWAATEEEKTLRKKQISQYAGRLAMRFNIEDK